MDFGPFPPATTAGPVNATASASAPTSAWLSQLQMQEHHLHSSAAQQRITPDTNSVDVDISMLGTADDVAVSSSSTMLPPVHTHSHPHVHSLTHQHQQTHHSMPVSQSHTYYSLSPFPYTTFNYGLSPYSSLSPTSQPSSSNSTTQHQQHWTVPISSYSSLNGATNSQPTASSSSSTAASSSSTTSSSRSPLPQPQQPQQLQMQSPGSSQQQQHSPIMMHQQQPSQHQYQPQQVQVQAMQSPRMPHSHNSTPTPPSTQHHQLSHGSTYLQQQQPQQSHQQPQVTIDPTLMLANYTNSYPPSAFYSYPQTLSLSPSLLHTSSSSLASANHPIPNHTSSQLSQVQLQQSGALSSLTGMPSRSTLTSVLNGLLAAKILTTPNQIVRTIITIGPTEVELPTRLQVLSKIRDCAGNDFYQAWALNTEAMDIIREWLKNAITSKSGEWEETIMPLLHVIDRLPLTVESLRSSKIGKVIVKLKEVSSSSAVKDMASNLENRWRSLVNTVDKSSLENGPKKIDGAKSVEAKKRKLEEAAMANKAGPAMKKLALSKPTTATGITAIQTKPVAVKKELGMTTLAVKGGMSMVPSNIPSLTTTTTVRDSKSDSSFFSAPKPKPKLPSFKKAPPLPIAKKDGPDPNVAQPSSVDPFKDALAAMTKARGSPTPSAAVAAANAAYAAQFQGSLGATAGVGMTPVGNNSDAIMITPTDGSTTGMASLTATIGKKKKKVAFKAEKDLVQIKFIEPAVYDDDVMGANGVYHNVRDLDRDEGAAMHKQIFEEQIDWMEPLLLELPAGVDTPRGQHSEEKILQEEREKSALNALYMPSQIPESPAEPANQIPDDEVDASVKHMLSGNEVRELTPDRGHGAAVGSGVPGVGLLGSALHGNGDMSTMSTLSVQGLISQLAAGLSAVGGSGIGGVGGVGGLSGLATPLGSGDIMNGDSAAPAAGPTQPMVDLKQLGLDINLIAQLASQHPNLTSSSSSTSSVNGYVLGNGASQASTGSNGSSAGYNDQNDWNGAGPAPTQYGDYSSSGQYEDENGTGHRSRNWDPSSDHTWRGRGGGGRGGKGAGSGRGGGSGFRHTKRKLCNFFANGRRANNRIFSRSVCEF